jgi:ATP-binding cassette subfamily B protein
VGFRKIDKQQRDVIWRMTKYVLKNYKTYIVTVMVCIVVASVASLASTLFTRTLVDDYIVPLTKVANPQYASLAQALFKLGLVLLLGVVCSYAYNRLMIQVSQGTMLKLRKQLFEHMQQLPISYFDRHKHGEVMSVYTNDIDSLRQMISTAMAQVFNSLITIVVTFSSMVILSVPLTIVSIAIAVLMMVATTKLGNMSRTYFKLQQHSLAQVNGFVEEMMTGQKVIKVFCHEDQAIADFENINEELRNSACQANKIANIVMPVNGNLGNMGYVLIAVVGAAVALSAPELMGMTLSISLGTIVAFLQLNKSFTQPITHVSQQINSVLNASVGAERVFALMDAETETYNGTWEMADGKWVSAKDVCKAEEKTVTHKVEGDVDFRHVDFGYAAEKQVLFDININTSPGQKIAFVGGTGAGKTTIINLINRFYEIQHGEILYDGLPITHIRKQSLRKSMSIVLQETHLFTASVLDNIRYGCLEASDEQCVEAARKVGADDFIRRLPNGYSTILSGDGGNLSQGERQLLAIARAAVANPRVLILDEATSSIDTRTEQLVQHGMDTIMQGRTTFVIAHRLSTVRNADMIIVMEQGRITEQGSHQQLLEQKGKYYQLCRSHGIA